LANMAPPAAGSSSSGTGERQLFPPSTHQRTTNFRFILLAMAAGYFFDKVFKKNLYPWGRPIPWSSRRSYSAVDYTIDGLQAKHGKLLKIYQRVSSDEEPRLIKGTETIVIHPKTGTLFAMTEDAQLVKISNVQTAADGQTASADVQVLHDLGMGRPLGGAFAGDTLWIADAHLGLTRLRKPLDAQSKVELVANSVWDPSTDQPSILGYVNDVTVGPQSGKIYFTDSSTVIPTRLPERQSWDTMYASKMDAFRAVPSGRLLAYDPQTDQVEILATGLRFANGISVSADESYLVVSETFGPKIWKYYLKGDQANQAKVLVEKMMGYPDGVTCESAAACYAVMPSSIVPLHKLVAFLPDILDIIVRYLVLAAPREMAPVSGDTTPTSIFDLLSRASLTHTFLLIVYGPTPANTER
jgi:sugar lactone lactonase YvrE